MKDISRADLEALFTANDVLRRLGYEDTAYDLRCVAAVAILQSSTGRGKPN